MGKGNITKEFIIEKAAVIFNKNGFAGASMSELMKETGLQKGGIYNHFKSKEAIYTALLEIAGPQLISVQIEDILEIVQAYKSAEKIRLIIEKITENWFQEPGSLLFLLMIRESPLFSLNVKTRIGQMVQKALLPLTHYFEKMQNQAVLRADFPAEFFSWQLLAPIANLRLNYLLPNACEEDKITGRRLIQLHLDYFIDRNFIL